MKRLVQQLRGTVSKVPGWIFAFLFVFVFSQLIGLELEIQREEWREEEIMAWFFPTAILSGAIALALSLQWEKFRQCRGLNKILDPEKKKKYIPFWALWFGCILCWLPYFLAFFPGILGYDFENQVNQYFFRKEFNTHHPLAHTLLMGWIIDIGEKLTGSFNGGGALYTFLQLVFMSAAVAYTLWKVQYFSIPRWINWGLIVFFYVIPIFPIMAISTTKDVLFACLSLMAVVTAFPLTKPEVHLREMVSFICFAVMAALMRNNAVYAYAILCIIYFVWGAFSKDHKYVIAKTVLMLVVIVAVVCLNATLENVLNASKGSKREMLSIPAQQFARVYTYEQDTLSEQDMATIKRYITDEGLENYNPWLADNAKGNLNIWVVEEDPVSFFNAWISMGERYFEEYLETFLIQNESLWYMGEESLLKVWGCFLELRFTEDYPGVFFEDSKIEPLKTLITMFVGRTAAVLKIPVLRIIVHPATYTWILLAALAVVMEEKKERYAFVILLPLCYLVTLLLGPCILPRYCLVAIMTAPVIMAFLVHKRNAHIIQEKCNGEI